MELQISRRLPTSRGFGQQAGRISRRIVTRALAATGVLALLLAMIVTVVPAPTAMAAAGINKQINFQGKVTNGNGTNVVDGNYSFTFKLYSVGSGGTAIWTETKTLTVSDGVFVTALGDTTALPGSVDFNTDNIYLGINFNSDGEMSPRIQFTAAAYAFNSDALQGLHASDFAQLNPSSAQSGGLNVTGNIQAGTSLQSPLVDNTGTLGLGTGATTTGVTVGRTAAPYLIQGNASSSFTATSGANTTTVGFTTPTGNNSILFPNAGGTLCTTVASTCSATYQAAGSYLAKNAADTSSVAVTTNSVLYSFTNSSTSAGSRVLDLSNAGTGTTLNVIASTNPQAGAALVKANLTAGSPSGSLLDLQVGSTSKFVVDASGNLTQANGSTTTDTINGQRISAAANFTGTVAVTTGLGINNASPANKLNVNALTTADAAAQVAIGTGGTGNRGLTVQAVGSQSADLVQLQDSTGVAMAAFGPGGNQLTLGRSAASGNVSQGKLTLQDGTTSTFGVTLQTSGSALSANRTLTLPNASGVVCLDSGNCDGTTGTGYILNQSATDQTADLRITGTARANTSVLTPLLDATTSGSALAIGTTNATGGINLNQNTAIASGKTLTVGGTALFQANAVSTTAFNIKTPASGTNGNMFTVDTQNGRVGINLGGTNTPNSTLEVAGTLRLSGTATENYATPAGANVPTKINIPIFDPGNFGQILAFGLPSSAQSTSRAISLFDARTGAHQPTIGVFSPDEASLVGFSWDGSNSMATVKTVDNSGVTDGVTVRSGDSSGTNASSGAVVIKSGDGTSTNTSSGNVSVDAGSATGTAGSVSIAGTNASSVSVGRTGANFTLQGLAGVSGSKITGSGGGFTTTLDFTTPTANVTLHVPSLAAGTYDVCTSANNCPFQALQGAYNSSTGGTTPEIKLDSTRAALDIQDADTTIGANLFNVRGSNASGLGSILFGVSNTGAVTEAGALTVSSGGASITGNSSVTGTLGVSNTLTVSSGGASITGNSSVTGTLGVSSTLTVSAGGASISGGLNNNTGGITNTGAIAGATNIGLTGTISGGTTYTASTALQAPVVDTASAVGLAIGGTNAASVTVGRTGANFTLQGAAGASGSKITGTTGSFTTTVDFTTPTANNAIHFPNAGGTLCTDVASTCNTTYQAYSSTGYILKNAQDSSAASVTGNLLSLTNNNSAGGVLSLSNSGSNSALSVAASTNPGANQALVFAKLTNAAVSGNLLDLWSGASGSETSKFKVTAAGAVTEAGALTVSSGGASITGNSSVSGTLGVNNTLTVSSGGASITGGINNNSGGVTNAGAISGATTIAANNTLTLSGTGANEVAVTGAPAASGTSSLVQLGSAIAAGNSQGTFIGINAGSGTTADFLNFQIAGSNKLKVDSTGAITSGTINGQTITSAANFTGTLTTANTLTVSAGGAVLNGGINNNAGGITNTGSLSGVGNIGLTGTISGGTTYSAQTALQAPLLDTATAAGLNVGTTNSTSVTIGKAASNYNFTLQGASGASGSLISATGASGTTNIRFADPSAVTTLTFPASATGSYTICTTDPGSCGSVYQTAAGGGYLLKSPSATESSTSSIAGNQYAFTNNNTGAAGVLSLTNAGTNAALTVTSSGNPTSGQALIVANNTNAAPGGTNLLDLQAGGTSKFSVSAGGSVTAASSINGQTITSAASFTGTLNVATGFKVAGAAASGSFLRGNGTNFVASTIQAADIPAGSSNYIQNQNASAQTTANFWISGTGRVDGGLTVGSGGASITGNSTVTGTLGVSSTLTVSAGGASISGGLNNNSGNITNAGSIAGATTIDANSTLTLSGTGATELAVTGAPAASATSSLIRAGNAISGGNSAANGGTYFGLNAPNAGAGSAADFLNFQLNGASKVKIDNTGAITAGTYNSQTLGANSIFTGTVSAVTGYRINGGATSGTFLRGDGTNYVASTIQAADVPAGSGNYIQNQNAGAQSSANFWVSGSGRVDNGFTVGANGASITGNSSITGTLGVTSAVTISGTGANELAVSGAPTASATSSLVQIGSAIAGGNAAANGGTYLGINRPGSGAGSAADFVNFQSAGTSKFLVDGNGAVTTASTINSQTISSAANFTGTLTVATGLTVTAGGINVNNSGITNAGAISGATTITANNTITGGGTFQTANGTTSNGINLQSGTSSAGASGAIVVRSGAATGGNSGSVTVDSGTSSGGTAGTVFIGTTNAPTVSIGRAAAKFFLQGLSGVSGSTITATNSGGTATTTLMFADPSASASYRFQDPGTTGTFNVCTQVASSCNTTYQPYSSTGYLLKSPAATEASTSNFTGYQYSFTQSASTAAGNLSLSNSGTNAALSVTAASNPSAGQAAILVNAASGVTSGNLLDLQKNGTSQFAVDLNGNVTTATGASSGKFNGQTISSAASFTGTVTSAQAVTVSSGGIQVTGNSNITGTLNVSNTFTVSAGGESITGGSSISGGLNNNAGGITNAGAVSGLTSLQYNTNGTLDTNNTANTISIGTTTAASVSMGRAGGTLSLQGNDSSSLTVTSSANGANTTKISFAQPTAANVIYQFGTATTGTYQICTSFASSCGTTYAPYYSGGYVQLAPASAQADGSTNSSIFINKTASGNLLKLQASATDVFTVQTNGTMTSSGVAYLGGTSSSYGLQVDTTNFKVRIGTGTPTQGSGGSNAGEGLFVSGATEASGLVLIGNTTNNASFDGTSHEVTFNGTARHTRRISLTPEYPGAVMTPNGSSNTGLMTSDFCSGTSHLSIPTTSNPCAASEEHNYYKWVSINASTQTYDIYVRYLMPSDFSAFTADNSIFMYGYRTTANDKVELSFVQNNGSVCGSATNVATTNTTWTETAITAPLATTCAANISANQVVTLRIRLTSTSTTNQALAGEIRFDYLSKY